MICDTADLLEQFNFARQTCKDFLKYYPLAGDVDNPRGVGGITRENPFSSDASSQGEDGLGPGINIGPNARYQNFRRRQ